MLLLIWKSTFCQKVTVHKHWKSHSKAICSTTMSYFLITDIINYRFLTTETNLKALLIYISLFVHNLISKAFCSECTCFCLQLCFSEKGKTTLTKPFTFWKWKHILKENQILRMKAHFENENMFLEKWKVINPF